MGRNPASGMEMIRESHSRTFSTTVEPIPLAAIITVASLPEMPSLVNSLNPSAAVPSVPAGMTCATAAADRSMRNSTDRLGLGPGGSSTLVSTA
jgi:hypothetical protein